MNNILSIWTKDGLLRDRNGDGIVDSLYVYIELPDGLVPVGLIDFCARLGFETTSMSFDIFEPKEDAIKGSFIQSDSQTKMIWKNRELMFLYKNEPELSTLLRLVAAMKPDVNMESSSIDLIDGKLYANQEVIPVASFERLEGEIQSSIKSLSHVWSFSGFGKNDEASPSKLLDMNVEIHPSVLTTDLLRELCCFAVRSAMYSTKITFPLTCHPSAAVQFEITNGSETVLELNAINHFTLKGKKDALPHALHHLARAKHWSEGGTFGFWEQEYQLKQKTEAPLIFELEWSDKREVDLAFAKLSKLGNLKNSEVEIFLSEPFEERKKWETEWKARFPYITSLTVRSAFKPGLHWFIEEIVPPLQAAGKPVERIEIKVQKEMGDQGLELPIRWIQELYPVDGFIEKTVGIKADQVTFQLEENLNHTYEVYWVNEKEEQTLVGFLDVPVSPMPYLDGKHSVYPVTGAIRILKEGKLVEEHLISTDRERFYRFYVEEVLPRIRREVANYNPGQGHTRPFFDRIEVDVWMSEEEVKLDVDEERISSLEALHEDVYFNTLDYFAYMGEELEEKQFNAPGGVHPFMHVRTAEKPEARIRVFGWDDKPLENWVTEAILFDEAGNLDQAIMTNGEKQVTVSIHAFEKPSHHVHADVEKWIREQTRYRIVYPDHSYRGHAIPVIECFLATEEEFYSPLKMSLFKKTVIIEAGHHSNEVSSTPAILQLLDRAEGAFKDWLKDFNVVVIPLANPDGYELLKKLTKEHPEWKHHAARYNAVGLEYSLVRFQTTLFGEANVYPEVLRRWAPDVIVDDHGIPSHEWVQPFAGYNSPPRFPVSYFLPSAKIYGIGRLSTGSYRSLHEENLETIVSNVSRFIRQTTIEQENQYWQERFIKYGNQWLPDVFPIEEAPGIHFYRQADVTPSYSTIGITRYPEWVAAEIISEVNDEVVYGEVLQSCMEAHIVFDLAILDVIQRADIEVKRTHHHGLAFHRQRPIRLSSSGREF